MSIRSVSPGRGDSRPLQPGRDPGEETSVRLLQIFSISLFLFPSNAVLSVVGASGYVASLLGLLCFGVWGVATLLGLHHPMMYRSPIRIGFGLLLISTLTSYSLFNLYVQPATEKLGADRWLIQLLSMMGVAFVAAEGLRSFGAVRRVATTLVWAGSFSAVVAVLQYFFGYNLSTYLVQIPGLTVNSEATSFQPREGLIRVAGTGIHPIEFGVVSGLLLPLAICLALYGDRDKPFLRWTPSFLLAFGSVVSVSRSAVLAVVAGMTLFVVLLPVGKRVMGLLLAPIGVVAAFALAPGFLRTITGFFSAGSADPSVQARTDDYPLAQELIAETPWFGRGPNNYNPSNPLEIFDNQYLGTAVTLGVLGLLAVVVYMVLPLTTAMSARRRLNDGELRSFGGAVAGSAAATVLCSVSFDSLSFPMFVGVQAMIAGLAGALWCMARAGGDEARPVDLRPSGVDARWTS